MLRIELRQSMALWAALLIAAVGVFVLFASNAPYPSWNELIITQRDIMQLTWPLALGAGAWQGIRDRRSRVEELLATTARPRRWRVVPVASAMAIGAVAGYLVMLAGAAFHLRHIYGYFPLAAVPIIALGAAAMVAAVWLGLAIGGLLPSPLTAPTLVVVGFVGLALVPPMLRVRDESDPGTALLLPYLQVPHYDNPVFEMLSTRASLSQALWFVALAVAGLAVYAAARPGTRVAAVLPVALGAALVLPGLPRNMADAWVENGHATELVCTPDPSPVCLPRAYSYGLDTVRGPAQRALSILRAKLPPAPTRVLVNVGDASSVTPLPPDTLLVFIPLDTDMTEYTHDDLLAAMLDGAGIRPCQNIIGVDPNQEVDPTQGEPPNPVLDRYLAARQVVTDWVLDRSPKPASGRADKDALFALINQALAGLRALPLDEQRSRINAFREAERICTEDDRMDLLTGGPR